MIKKRYIVITILFMVFIGLQLAQPTNAAKLIDHGTYKQGSYKSTWKTYQYSSKYVQVNIKTYNKGKVSEKQTISIRKIKKNRIRVIITQKGNIKLTTDIIKDYYIKKQFLYYKTSRSVKNFYSVRIKKYLRS